jgi:hypothetical protein
MADLGALGFGIGGFGYSRVDMLVGDATGAQVAGDAVFALAANVGALADELFSVAGIVNQAVLFEAADNFFYEIFIRSAANEGLFHFVHGMGPAHEDLDGGFVEGGLRVDGAWLGEHEGRIEARRQGSKEARRQEGASSAIRG